MGNKSGYGPAPESKTLKQFEEVIVPMDKLKPELKCILCDGIISKLGEVGFHPLLLANERCDLGSVSMHINLWERLSNHDALTTELTEANELIMKLKEDLARIGMLAHVATPTLENMASIEEACEEALAIPEKQ